MKLPRRPEPPAALAGRIHRRLVITLQGLLALGVALALFDARWMAAATTFGVLLVSLLPTLLGRRLKVHVPAEFELLAVVFIYAALFLGEVRGYYVRFWWWDLLLHTMSGFLLGLLGFLLVYVLNEKPALGLHMKPGFVALFAFMFALGVGTLWEIFEFAMDQAFGLNMQKSGLQDTMGDLIVDAIGALVIALIGWSYLKTAGSKSFLERRIRRFVDENPRLFPASRQNASGRG
ncbi:hypothetical protein [Candidatus Laterigemmans baculatus]|uniref:hypothetical protein n=1 Tax=Candidatus Laterigemmans baculatus TaxID=2770505 RepID=UPI0013DA1F27|nr:hypothetical protein [Candidatus Laterigemmans baculatus]